MDFQEVGSEGMAWIGLAQERDMWLALVNAVMKFGEFFDQLRTGYLLKKDTVAWIK